MHQLGNAQSEVFAVLRTSDVKFRKPAHGALRASAVCRCHRRFAGDRVVFVGRALASVLVEVADARGVVTMSGQYDWFLQRQTNTA